MNFVQKYYIKLLFLIISDGQNFGGFSIPNFVNKTVASIRGIEYEDGNQINIPDTGFNNTSTTPIDYNQYNGYQNYNSYTNTGNIQYQNNIIMQPDSYDYTPKQEDFKPQLNYDEYIRNHPGRAIVLDTEEIENSDKILTESEKRQKQIEEKLKNLK